ncbi:hypothetical protein ABBQ38_000071 [Trebouxia sp. C0009 RCD-2024]
MELDAQVEETLQASGTVHKHKHKKKDKHKHKHHKKSKRDRHADPEQNPASKGLQVEGEVARTGSEDGELPGPPVVEALTAAPNGLEATDAKGRADSTPAGPEHTNVASADRPPAKRRPEQSLLADSSKRSRVDQSGVPDHPAPVDTVPTLHPALVSQPSLNGRSPSSSSVPVSDSAGVTLKPVSDHEANRRASQQPEQRPSDIPDVSILPEAAASHQRTNPPEQPSHSGRPQDSHRPHRSDSRHRSSSQRPRDSSRHRSTSHRPADASKHRDASRLEPRPVSRSHHTGSDRQVSYSDRQSQPSRPDRSDYRGSHDVRQRPDSRAGGHSRDVPPGRREYGRDRPRDYRNGNHLRHDSDRDAGRHDRRRESDSHRDKRKREEKEDKAAEQEFVAKVEAALEANDVDEDQLIEERRRRRQEILAKHQQGQAAQPGGSAQTSGRSASPAPSVPSTASPHPTIPPGSPANGRVPPASPLTSADSAQLKRESVQAAPAEVAHVDVLAELPPVKDAMGGAESPSISDDEQYQKLDGDLWQQGEGAGQLGSGARPAGTVVAPDTEPEVHLPKDDDRKVAREAAEEVKEAVVAAGAKGSHADAGGLDMFADNVDADMFAGDAPLPQGTAPVKKALLDNYDDAEGYYNFQVGEVMDGRYEVFATHGKGVFSTVLRARDQQCGSGPSEVAIKIIRANETMSKAAQTEKVVLRKLSGADPDNRRHCIKLLRTFEYRGHLCLAFEAMDINLRELTKKYGRGIGLNIAAVSKYSAQMLISLYHLRNCGVLHADVKPDNILVSASRTMVKLADFGSAMFSGDNEITPYLVSRFYRAPEVILGLKYDHALDIWSVGCVIYELFTGKILFPGKTNNEMLKLIMDVKGPFPKKMLKKGAFTDRHFEDDPNMSFAMLEEDAVTKRPIRRTIAAPHVKKDFAGLLAGSEGDRKKVTQLADLLERMMALDPDKRITPKDALKHPFIKEPKA